jgi:hypothetical protein
MQNDFSVGGEAVGGQNDSLRGAIDGFDQAADAALPFSAFFALLFGDCRLFHGNQRGGAKCFSIFSHRSSNEDTIAGLKIAKSQGRGFLQIGLPRFDLKKLGCVFDRNGRSGAGIRQYGQRFAVDHLDGSEDAQGRGLLAG